MAYSVSRSAIKWKTQDLSPSLGDPKDRGSGEPFSREAFFPYQITQGPVFLPKGYSPELTRTMGSEGLSQEWPHQVGHPGGGPLGDRETG